MPTFVVASLYCLCFALLGGLVVVITFIGGRTSRGHKHKARLRRIFFLLVLSLLVWQLTLLLEVSATQSLVQLYLGRVNFAAIACTTFLALRFVQEVAGRSLPFRSALLLLGETGLLTALTVFTPLIDAAESVPVSGPPVTQYGVLFPLYLLHVLGYLGATIYLILRARCQEPVGSAVRRQLTLIGGGIGATGGIALITNVWLPYGFGEFRYGDVGPLATLLFGLAVAYAVFMHGLFDLRIVLRETLVYGILLTFVLGGYSSALYLVTEHLTAGAGKVTQFAVLLIAFSLDPLRRFLEKKIDRWLFDRDGRDGKDK